MKRIRRQSLVEITADHLRTGFSTGRWLGLLPGVLSLAAELDVSKDTVRAALQLLEREGSLQGNGAGRSRKIMTRRIQKKRTLRIAILLSTPLLQDNAYSQRMIMKLKSEIEADGHVCIIEEKAYHSLTKNMRRLARVVEETEADAWVVYGGSHALLKWLAARGIPILALGGRHQEFPIPSTRTDVVEALNESVDALVALGHRRIVLIAGEHWRLPFPSINTIAFLDRLSLHNIPGTDYNVPAWEETPEGLEQLLNALFFATPPTALLLSEPAYSLAVRTMLTEKGLLVPRDVSMVNMLPDPVFYLQRPAWTHFEWPEMAHVQRILRWVKALQSGREDRETYVANAKFVLGGTIGPVKKR